MGHASEHRTPKGKQEKKQAEGRREKEEGRREKERKKEGRKETKPGKKRSMSMVVGDKTHG